MYPVVAVPPRCCAGVVASEPYLPLARQRQSIVRLDVLLEWVF